MNFVQCSAIFLLSVYTHGFSIQRLEEDPLRPEQTLEYDKEYEATVTISYGRNKRSPEELDTDSVHLKLTVLNSDYEVKLRKPRSSIFAPNFNFEFHSKDSEMKEMGVRDVTPSKSELDSIESNHYISDEEKAAFSINNKTGEVHGVLNDMAVSTAAENGTQTVILRKPANYSHADFLLAPGVTLPQLSSLTGRSAKADSKKVAYSKPEILVVWDLQFYKFFKGNNTAMLDYTAIYFHIVNYYYGTLKDPKIKFIVSGMRAAATMEAQDDIMGKKATKGYCRIYNVNTALSQLRTWIFKNKKTLPPWDVAMLITDTDLQITPNENSCGDNLAGLAFCGTACDWMYGMGASQGGRGYSGIVTVAHEAGHILGGSHTKAGVMGNGLMINNSVWFDPINAKQFKAQILSRKCLREINSKTPEIPEEKKKRGKAKGKTFVQLCKELLVGYWNPKPKDGRSADDNCKSFTCQYFVQYIEYQGFGPADDGTICNDKGGICRNKRCNDRLDRIFFRQGVEADVEW